MRSRKNKNICTSTETLEIRDVKAAAMSAALTDVANPPLSDFPATAGRIVSEDDGWSRPWGSMTPIDLQPAAGVVLELGEGRRFEFDSPTSGTLVHPDGTHERFVDLEFKLIKGFDPGGSTTREYWQAFDFYAGRGEAIGNYVQKREGGAYAYMRFGGTLVIKQAEAVDREHHFSPTEKDFENWGGKGEKWFWGGNGNWHFITPDGSIFLWTVPGKAEGRLVAKVDASFHQFPVELTTAADSDMEPAAGVVLNLGDGNRFEFTGPETGKLIQASGSVTHYVDVVSPLENGNASIQTNGAPLVGTVHDTNRPIFGVAVYESARVLDGRYGFQLQDKLFENWGGREEKWFQGSGGLWHFITPDGSIFRQTVSGKAEGRHIASVDPTFYRQPELLTTSSDSMETAVLYEVFSNPNSVAESINV